MSTEIDAQIASLQARAEQAQQRLQSLSATAASPDGAVSVTVVPGGALTDLRLTQRAYDQRPEQLAALVMSLVGKAQRQVGGEVREASSGMVGEHSAAMGVLDQYLPAPAEEEPAERRRQPPRDDDDYFANPF